MITDKQKQRDNEYDGEYQVKSSYSSQQWKNILTSSLEEEDLTLLKMIYSSYNHAANLVQLSWHLQTTEDDLAAHMNQIGQKLGEANGMSPETNFDGEEYWWYLCCWGKELTDGSTLEWKLQPELTDAIGEVWPELEESYYAFMSDVTRSLQIRYTQEQAVWIAAATLLYEKYYTIPGITADDILLMQYEVQTRAQKVFGQDVDVRTITQVCNADERGHRFNYLRDLYKYYRVSFPGEFEGDLERPDPKDVDYSAYIYSLLGYMTLNDLYDFISHEYAHLVDESYVDLNNSNGFVRIADFLSRQQGKTYNKDDTSDAMLDLKSAGEDCITTFRMLGDSLIKEYPNFTYGSQVNWYDPLTGIVSKSFCDTLCIPDYTYTGACIAIMTVMEEDSLNIEVSLNLPFCNNENAMLDIEDKCNMLTLMTAAPFNVETVPTESYDYKAGVNKYKASVIYSYDEIKGMTEENITETMGTAMQILASYYTDICQNLYPAKASEDEDPLAAALGDKLIYREGHPAPGPNIIYKEPVESPTADFIVNALNGTAANAASQTAAEGAAEGTLGGGNSQPLNQEPAAKIPVEARPVSPAAAATVVAPAQPVMPYPVMAAPQREKVPVAKHVDRSDQTFHLYPKNTLIQGPPKTGKYHEAIVTAVGIIEGKDYGEMDLEAVPDILGHYKDYVEEGKILNISCPDIAMDGFGKLIEREESGIVIDGIIKEFANHCAEGRYVIMMEECDVNWLHLFGEAAVLLRENRREGASSETCITLPYSKDSFRLPSNLYIIATCDSIVSEDTILQAVNLDFYIKKIEADSSILRGVRIEGIRMDRVMEAMNQRISYFLGKDYQLGEGFFMGDADNNPMNALAKNFKEQIIPVLEKWFDGDIEQLRYVLGDNAKRRADAVFFREIPFNDHIFKGRLPDSFDTGRSIYELNDQAFRNPRSYIEIYE